MHRSILSMLFGIFNLILSNLVLDNLNMVGKQSK